MDKIDVFFILHTDNLELSYFFKWRALLFVNDRCMNIYISLKNVPTLYLGSFTVAYSESERKENINNNYVKSIWLKVTRTVIIPIPYIQRINCC